MNINYKVHRLDMKLGLFILLSLTVFSTVSFAQTTTFVKCLNNQTAEMNITISTSSNGVFYDVTTHEFIKCPYGCDNVTKGSQDCFADPTDSNINYAVPAIIFIIISGLLFYLSTQSKGALWMTMTFFAIGLAILTFGVVGMLTIMVSVSRITFLVSTVETVYIVLSYITYLIFIISLILMARDFFAKIQKEIKARR